MSEMSPRPSESDSSVPAAPAESMLSRGRENFQKSLRQLEDALVDTGARPDGILHARASLAQMATSFSKFLEQSATEWDKEGISEDEIEDGLVTAAADCASDLSLGVANRKGDASGFRETIRGNKVLRKVASLAIAGTTSGTLFLANKPITAALNSAYETAQDALPQSGWGKLGLAGVVAGGAVVKKYVPGLIGKTGSKVEESVAPGEDATYWEATEQFEEKTGAELTSEERMDQIYAGKAEVAETSLEKEMLHALFTYRQSEEYRESGEKFNPAELSRIVTTSLVDHIVTKFGLNELKTPSQVRAYAGEVTSALIGHFGKDTTGVGSTLARKAIS